MIRCLCFETHAQDGLRVSLSGVNGTEPIELAVVPMINTTAFSHFWNILNDRFTLTDEASIFIPQQQDDDTYSISYDTSNFNYLVPLFTLLDGWLRLYGGLGIEIRILF